MAACKDLDYHFDIRHKLNQLIDHLPDDKLLDLIDFIKKTSGAPNHRCHQRKPFLIPVDCITGDQRSQGFIMNMSQTGAYIKSPHPASPGQTVTLTFSVLNFEKPVCLEGDIIWRNQHGMGLVFSQHQTLANRLNYQKVADAVKSS